MVMLDWMDSIVRYCHYTALCSIIAHLFGQTGSARCGNK